MKRPLLIGSLGLCVALVVIGAMGWRAGSSVHRPLRDLTDAPLARTVDDPASNDADLIDWVGAGDFRFAMGDGNGNQSYNVLQIEADGRCTYTFAEGNEETDSHTKVASGRGRQATFHVDAETLATFRRLLKDVDFCRLKREYHADVEDGTQRWARVEASGHRKAVYCNNFFPPAFLRISRFVNDRIIAPNSSAIDEAATIALDPQDLELNYFK